jgi:acyl-CoA thioester hydrolase
MRPPAFVPAALPENPAFVREEHSGLVYHRVEHRVLYADTDRSGVVYHANYLRYFELGRAALMREVGYPYAEVEDSGYVYPIVDLRIRYLQALHYDDPMWVHTRPADRDRVKVTFDYVITHQETGVQICRGYTQHCALNTRGVPVAVDDTTVKTWETFPR